MPTRRDARQLTLQRIGGWHDQVDDSPDASTVQSNELMAAFKEATLQSGWTIHLPDAPVNDRRRRVTGYNPDTGTLTLATPLANPATVGWDLELYQEGDPGPQEIDRATNRALQQTPRSVWSYLPTVTDAHEYPLGRYPWIQSNEDVLRVFLRNSPNLVDNESFGLWGNGSKDDPARWTIGAGTLTRVDAFEGWAARLANSAASAASLYQEVTTLRDQLASRPLVATANVFCATADRVRLYLDDGTRTVTSGFHPGNGRWVRLDLTGFTVAANPTRLRVGVEIVAGAAATAMVTRVTCIERETIADRLADQGSDIYFVRALRPAAKVLTQGAPVLYVKEDLHRGDQLAIASLQPYAPLAEDDDETACDLQAVSAGAILEIASKRARAEDQTRWRELEVLYTRIYAKHAARERMIPAPNLNRQQVSVGKLGVGGGASVYGGGLRVL